MGQIPCELSAQRDAPSAESAFGTSIGGYHPHGCAQEMAHRVRPLKRE